MKGCPEAEPRSAGGTAGALELRQPEEERGNREPYLGRVRAGLHSGKQRGRSGHKALNAHVLPMHARPAGLTVANVEMQKAAVINPDSAFKERRNL